MKNLILAFGFGFLTHFVISKYLIFDSTKSVSDSDKNLSDGFLDAQYNNNKVSDPKAETKVSALNNNSLLSENQNKELDFSNCPTTAEVQNPNQQNAELEYSKEKNKKIFKKFESMISDRKILNMDSKDLSLMADKVLSDPGLTLARSNLVTKYSDLKALNGVFEGHLNSTDPSGELKSVEAYIEIDFNSDFNKNAVGKYRLELKGQGTSSGDGTPNGFKRNNTTSDFFIQFGPDHYLQVTELDQFLKANYYKNNELAGFAKLKRIR